VALIDWDLAGPAEPLDDVVSAASHWAPFQIRRGGYELHKRLGGEERRAGWREMWDAGSGETILGNLRLLEQLRPELEAALA
jgi:aminoglycoside phosphotransferase (APT) family kinase protein